jgi:hypothetical protein
LRELYLITVAQRENRPGTPESTDREIVFHVAETLDLFFAGKHARDEAHTIDLTPLGDANHCHGGDDDRHHRKHDATCAEAHDFPSPF